MSVELMGPALRARGLTTEQKLTLILVAEAADMDGHLFGPYDDVAAAINVTPARFRQVVAELNGIGLAGFVMADSPETGRSCEAVALMFVEDDH